MNNPIRTATSLLLALTLALSAFVAVPASEAQAQATPVRDAGMEAGFLASVNQQRANAGVGPLTLHAGMSEAAAGWAFQMANGSFLSHASNITGGIPGTWAKAGENVGRGESVASLTSAFMNSPAHRAAMLDPSFDLIGIGVYIHPTGRVYTTHRFADVNAASPAPTVTPERDVAVVVATPVPATPVPATPVPTAVAPTAEPLVTNPDIERVTSELASGADATEGAAGRFGPAPTRLAFVDEAERADAVIEKAATKQDRPSSELFG